MTTNNSQSLTSNQPATKAQVRRARTLTAEAMDMVFEASFTHDELQLVHGHAAPFKEELTAAVCGFIREFARRRTPKGTPKAEPLPTPAVDEWFDLEVNDDMDPMLVVSSAGFDVNGWSYLGPQFSGKKTYRVKLVELEYVQNLDDAKAKAQAKNPKYRLLEGQAREAFKAKYPRHNGRPVIFGGSEWRRPSRNRDVAYLGYLRGGAWRSRFYWSDRAFSGFWLWAVVEQD